MSKEDERELGKNCFFSERQRAAILELIKVVYKTSALQSEEAHDLVKSIRVAVDFTAAELEIRTKRIEKKLAEKKTGVR